MTIDQVCSETTNPTLLNALHACRKGHPLNNSYCWINAYSIAVSQPFSKRVSYDALRWLEKQAELADRKAV